MSWKVGRNKRIGHCKPSFPLPLLVREQRGGVGKGLTSNQSSGQLLQCLHLHFSQLLTFTRWLIGWHFDLISNSINKCIKSVMTCHILLLSSLWSTWRKLLYMYFVHVCQWNLLFWIHFNWRMYLKYTNLFSNQRPHNVSFPFSSQKIHCTLKQAHNCVFLLLTWGGG